MVTINLAHLAPLAHGRLMLLEFAQQIGLTPKKVASTYGGEYHCACPVCGGKDRFYIQPERPQKWCKGHYSCRQCGISGDTIQFLRDYFHYSYREACERVGAEPSGLIEVLTPRLQFEPVESLPPSISWSKRAQEFIGNSHQLLLKNPMALNLIKERGITLETARKYRVGWNPKDLFENKSDWGLPEEIVDGKIKRQWLPKGLILPSFGADGIFQKIKIRRANWFPEDKLPKYVEVSGSRRQFGIYGEAKLPIVLVEAEIDAMLIQQEAGTICRAFSLGGASKKPDKEVHRLLLEASSILYSLDFDEAGARHISFWSTNYSNLLIWPAPWGKSPEESFKKGLNLMEWVQVGLEKTASLSLTT